MTAQNSKPYRDLTLGRECTRCHTYRERSFFYEHPTGYNGLGSRCTLCLSSLPISPKKKECYDQRRRLKQCVRCGKSPTVNSVFCTRCWFRSEAHTCAGGMKNTDFILELWQQQDGRCYYTSEPLTPGNNASLDHQQPRCRGGQNLPKNLRWVCRKNQHDEVRHDTR